MSVYIPVALKQQVKQHFDYCCAYCQSAEQLMAVTFEIEHITPLTKGGQSTLSNLCLACPTCNRYKGVKQHVKDLQTKEIVSLFHPQKEIWTEHFTWIKQACQIKGLTATGRATIESLKMNRPQIVQVRKLWVRLQVHPPKTSSFSIDA